MNLKNKEGSYYASKVRLFLNEYGGIDLQEFCKAEKVSYTKMCHCLGRPSYRKPKEHPSSEECYGKQESDSVLPVIDLQPLVIDKPDDLSRSHREVSTVTKDRQKQEPGSRGILSDVTLTLSGRLDVRIGSCEVRTLVTLMKEMEVTLC